MLCIVATYVVKPGNEQQLIEYLEIMTRHTRSEPGNLMYLAHRSLQDPRRFVLYEQYADQAAIDAHRAAPYFEKYVLNGIVPLLESRTPELFEPIG